MQITVCDICGTRKDVKKVWLPYDRKMDPAGAMEDVGETYDLCCKCHLKVLQDAIREEINARKIAEQLFNQDLIKLIKMRINQKAGIKSS